MKTCSKLERFVAGPFDLTTPIRCVGVIGVQNECEKRIQREKTERKTLLFLCFLFMVRTLKNQGPDRRIGRVHRHGIHGRCTGVRQGARASPQDGRRVSPGLAGRAGYCRAPESAMDCVENFFEGILTRAINLGGF